MDSLLKKHALSTKYFHLFSFDVEGVTLSLLERSNFDKVTSEVILAEAEKHNRNKNIVLRLLLEQKTGYKLLYKKGTHYWFIKPNFDNVYNQNLVAH